MIVEGPYSSLVLVGTLVGYVDTNLTKKTNLIYDETFFDRNLLISSWWLYFLAQKKPNLGEMVWLNFSYIILVDDFFTCTKETKPFFINLSGCGFLFFNWIMCFFTSTKEMFSIFDMKFG